MIFAHTLKKSAAFACAAIALALAWCAAAPHAAYAAPAGSALGGGSDNSLIGSNAALVAAGELEATDPEAGEPEEPAIPAATLRAAFNGGKTWKAAGDTQKSAAIVGKNVQAMKTLQFKLNMEAGLKGNVEYQVYIKGYGWQAAKKNGKIAGSASEKTYQVEAVRIALSGDVSRYYDVFYRTDLKKTGWETSWKKNGEAAGAAGKGRAVERVQVYLQPKAKPASNAGTGIVGLTYRVRMQQEDPMSYVLTGATAGKKGSGLRVDQMQVFLNSGTLKGGIEYRTVIYRGKKFTPWLKGGKVAGTKGKRIDALQIRLTGEIAKQYSVQYRVALKGAGWQPWVANGGTAGSIGSTKRIEALQIKLVQKAKVKTSLAEGTYVITAAAHNATELSVDDKGKVARASYDTARRASKFYLRQEAAGQVSLQSVSTGKFLAGTSDGAVALQAWSAKSANQVWKVTYNGGYRFTNKATGQALKLKGSAVSTAKGGSGFFLNATKLANDGSYTLANVGQKKVLDVADGSDKSGANIQVAKADKSGDQVFTFKVKKDGSVTIANMLNGLMVGTSKADVRQYKPTGKDAQLWVPSINRDGSFTFVNKATGKALAANAKGNAVNTKANVASPAKAQEWKLEEGTYTLTGNPELDAYVLKIAKKNGNNLRRCFNWMGSLRHVQQVDGRRQWGIMSDKVLNSYALYAARDHKADCYVDAAMFCWLARACGYKANMRAGGCPSASGGTVAHGWTEVYRNGKTYVCDANLKRDLPSYNWYMNTYSGSPVTYSK